MTGEHICNSSLSVDIVIEVYQPPTIASLIPSIIYSNAPYSLVNFEQYFSCPGNTLTYTLKDLNPGQFSFVNTISGSDMIITPDPNFFGKYQIEMTATNI